MRSIVRAACAALVLTAAVPSALAQAPAECRDDHGVDRCDPARQAKTEALFGVPPLAALKAKRAQARRVFFVDGYGRDVAVLTFVKKTGADPLLEVALSPVDGRPRKLSARLEPSVWAEAAAPAFIEVPPPLTDASGDVRICLHGWMTTVDMVEADGSAQRRTGHACADNEAFRLGFQLADVAVKALPACAALDPQGYRNSVMQLVGCGQLEGDLATAAAARNWLDAGRLLAPTPATLPKEIAPLLAEDAVLRWPGEREVVGREAVAASWLFNLTKDPEPDFWPTRYRGAAVGEAVVEGRLRYWTEGETPVAHEAAARLTLQRAGPDFRLRRIEVGRFEVVRG